MKLSLITALALAGAAVATPAQGGGKQIPNGQPCKKDGSMGVCAGGFCLQEANKPQGVCKPQH